jgi:hypothetical protein
VKLIEGATPKVRIQTQGQTAGVSYQETIYDITANSWTQISTHITVPAGGSVRMELKPTTDERLVFLVDNFNVTNLVTPLNVTADMETANTFSNYRSLGNFGHTGGETIATYAVTGSAISVMGYNSEKSEYIETLANWHGACYYINNTDTVAVTYTVSAWVKLIEGVTPKVRIQTQGQTTGVNYQEKTYDIVTGTWTKISTQITVTAGGSVRMELKSTTDEKTVFLVDDFNVKN